MQERIYTLKELASFNQAHNAHLIISGKVYDISKFAGDHPGGDEIILSQAGQDATLAFEDIGHSSDALEQMKAFLVGSLDEESIKLLAEKGAEATVIRSETITDEDPPSSAHPARWAIVLALFAVYLTWRLQQ